MNRREQAQRDVDRARAFGARAFYDGSLGDYHRATKLAWEHEDRQREARARKVATVLAVGRAVPWWVWLIALVVCCGIAWKTLAAIAAHPIVTTLVVVIATVVFLAAKWALRPQHAVVDAEVIAPPDLTRKQTRDPLAMALPAEARAVVDGLTGARQGTYMQALEMQLIGAPSRRALEGRDIVEAQLPGGSIRPEDVDVTRLAQTLGFEPDRVRRMPAPAGLLMVELLHTRPAELVVPAWPALGQATAWDEDCPLGVDLLGHPVTLPLLGARVMVAGASGSGKTVTLRMLAAYAAADPRVRLHIFDHKGAGDFAGLADRAETYHCTGADVPDEVVASLDAIRAEMRAWYVASGRGEAPERVPTVVVIDEVQALAGRARNDAFPIVEEIARQGRAAGFSVLLGSQLATKTSVPVAVLGQCDVRIVHRQGYAWAGGQLLEDHATDVLALPNGHAQVWDMRDGRRVRVGVHYVQTDDVRRHVEGLPALPPAPAREAITDPTTALLDDALDVIGDAKGATWATLRDVLGDDAPDALRAAGVASSSVYDAATGKTARGARRADVEAARKA